MLSGCMPMGLIIDDMPAPDMFPDGIPDCEDIMPMGCIGTIAMAATVRRHRADEPDDVPATPSRVQ